MPFGSPAVIGSLLDYGATADRMWMRTVETARPLELHPVQFEGLAAVIAYAAVQFIGEFMYSVD